ncbi:MAG: FAD-dependent oxidoreductase [Actinomycetaceae bacterium]|nr:FAD-dependent oxidoreductase [Actinomycetaceae bacterium]
MTGQRLDVAIIGAGPAGIYAADILAKSDIDVAVDIFERLPAPYGLVRYGVAPDHPRIRQIIDALYAILQRGDINLLGNVNIGEDITIDDLRDHYDAVIFATGSDRDAPIDLPGQELEGCYGAADFVSWYDGHPDYSRSWPLNAPQVAVIGVGNVALDVARILAKHYEDLLTTEIPPNVAEMLATSPITDVHVFGRRGPAQVKFTPLELRELGQIPGVDIIVYEEDFDFDEGSQKAINASKQTKQVVKTLMNFAMIPPEDRKAPRRIHIHMFHSPVEVLGDEHGNVRALVTERTALQGDGSVSGTGELVETPVQAVYRAVGYFSSPLPGVPFDEDRGIIPNVGGRVTSVPIAEGETPDAATILPGVYATGWVKRGPVGLIGSTKSDAQETIANLLEDAAAGRIHARSMERGYEAITKILEAKDVPYTTWQGWELLNQFEKQLGEDYGEVPGGRGPRERVKVVAREAMTAISLGAEETEVPDLIGEAPEKAKRVE